jgi:hypothetical protein
LVVIWDNYSRPIHANDALCVFMTAATFSGRVLGVSDSSNFTNRALFIGTGNNIDITGDVARRILKCRIDANSERPSLRVFDIDPVAWMRAHRDKARCAALTLLRGFYTAGAPSQTLNRAGSFEDWDHMVRQCVLWLGAVGVATVSLGDPLKTAIESMDQDSQAGIVSQLLDAWYAEFDESWMSVTDVLGKAAQLSEGPLVTALEEAADDKYFTSRSLNRYLRKHRGEVLRGLKLKARKDGDTKNWRFQVIKNIDATIPTDPLLL